MSSEHAGHDHTHGMAKQTLRLAFFLSLIIVAAEVTGGLHQRATAQDEHLSIPPITPIEKG